MTLKPALLALCAALTPLASVAAAGQATAPAAAQPPANPFQSLWTGWSGASRDSLEAEIRTQAQPDRAPPDSTSIPAGSPLFSRSREEAEALGARVGEIVRGGDCAEGERVARAAGDFALVQAVRDHCERRAARR
ncbi:MAG: hypothetical protein QOD42_1175 [Sphingomonadales bacterium]|jgi:hypothetical protein|nr:hypothetical protein [Sphingomonadales bacterium]